MSTSTPQSSSARVAINPNTLPPSTEASSTPLPYQLTTSLTTALLSANAIPRIQSALLHELQSEGWTARLREFVLECLRSGRAGSYAEVMGLVMREIVGRGGEGEGEEDEDGEEVNGEGTGEKGRVDVKVPEKVIRKGLEVVRRELEGVCEVQVEE